MLSRHACAYYPGCILGGMAGHTRVKTSTESPTVGPDRHYLADPSVILPLMQLG